MSSNYDIAELEKEMMELFDDYGYNSKEKEEILKITKSMKTLDDISDDNYIDMNYISTSGNDKGGTHVDMIVQPKKKEHTQAPNLVEKDFINNILNDKIIDLPKKATVYNDRDNDFLLDQLDEETQKQIKKELADENSELFSVMEEHSDTIFHLKKLELIKNKVYKSFFRGRRRSSATSIVSDTDTEIELSAEDIEYAIEKENDLIGILLKNIKKYLDDNDIKYNDILFDLSFYEGYKIVDDPKEEIDSKHGIILINVVPNNKIGGQKCVCYNTKCVVAGRKNNMIVTTKNFQKFRYINTNKLLFKKIKMNDICHLIEKHKK